jgi:hypothetical protein
VKFFQPSSFLPTLLLLLCPVLAWADPATIVRPAELKKAPATDAATVAELAADTRVESLERKGGWTRIKTDTGAEGWVKMLSLRYGGPGQAKQGSSGFRQLFNVARSGTSGTTVTTGVRGLDAEMLAAAQPNAAELKKLEAYSMPKAAATAFAAAGKLTPKNVDYPATP